MLKIASYTVLLPIVIEPWYVHCQNKSYSKTKQTRIVKAKFILLTLLAFFIIMATQQPPWINQKIKQFFFLISFDFLIYKTNQKNILPTFCQVPFFPFLLPWGGSHFCYCYATMKSPTNFPDQTWPQKVNSIHGYNLKAILSKDLQALSLFLQSAYFFSVL